MNCKETNKFEEFVNYKNSQNEYKNNLENTHNRNNKSNNECAICENNYSQQNPQNSRISKNWQGCNSTNLMPTTPNAQSNNKLESSKGEIEIQGANRLSFSSKKYEGEHYLITVHFLSHIWIKIQQRYPIAVQHNRMRK